MKKFFIIVGSLVFLIVAAMVVIPLVVDLDKYRPQIEQMANEHIHGKLELGKLSLSLWGQIRIEVAGVTLTDTAGNQIISVNDAYFHLPFSSILSGSPILTFKMQKPVMKIVKSKSGKLNVLSLLKEAPSATGPGALAPSQPSTGGTPSPGVTLPALATRARLGVELKNALLTYKDQMTGLDTQIKDLNVLVKDVSLSRPMEIEVSAEMDTQLGTAISVRGPSQIKGEIKPQFSRGHFEQVAVSLKANLNDLEIDMPGLFIKKKGIPANAEVVLSASAAEAKIDKLEAQFHNAEIKASGTITHLTPMTSGGVISPVVHIQMQSNEIELKPWAELVPMLKDYELGGSAKLDAEVDGPSDRLGYHANLALKAITAKAPQLKTQPRIDGIIHVVTDQIDNISLSVKAPGNDLLIRGKILSFIQPHLELFVTSSGMDLDQLIEFPQKAQAPTAASAGGGAAFSGKNKLPTVDYDSMVAPLRENKMALLTTANLNVNIKHLKAYNVKMTDILSRMTLRDLTAAVENFEMGLWNGVIKASMSLQLRPNTPTYRFGTQVTGLELQQAVASQFSLFKNTLLGKANFRMDGSGASFNPDSAISNLSAKGNLKVTNATFATIDVGRMATEAINKAMDRISEKVPQLKGKGLKTLPSGQSRYEFISSDFTISGGVFKSPNFLAKAEPNRGIDIKGDTTVGMKDFSLKTTWEIVDTYNLTHARDLSVEQNGVHVEHILAEGSQPVRLPVRAGCTLMAPCYSYTEVPEYLAKVALNNASHAFQGKAKAEARKKIEELTKQAPEPLQKALKGLSGKLWR